MSETAKPGPHPHESKNVEAWAGSDPKLPEGVEPYQSELAEDPSED